MRHATLCLVLGSFLLLTGCEPTASLHPLITPEAAIFEPSLLGDWIAESKDDSKESTVLTFSRRDESDPLSKDYSVKFGNSEEHVRWVGRLGRINEELYLDLSPEVGLFGDGRHLLQGVSVDPAFEQVLALGEGLLLVARAENAWGGVKGTVRQLRLDVSPVHWFFNVRLAEKGLRLGYLDDENLSKLIQDKKVEIDCVLQPQFFLTAETYRLREFVIQRAYDSDAFTWVEYEKAETKCPCSTHFPGKV